jgi:5'-nucleotidase (lipoprotein e(P4) family)
VILDVDETVLDNSFYNARNVVTATPFSSRAWNDWCIEEKAELIPGAFDFIQAAEGLNVKIFYLTNREDEVKQATINNLKRLGLNADQENVLTLNPAAGRGDDKLTRRATVAEHYRVVLLIGDSMSDLCSEMDPAEISTRNQVAAEKSNLLGTRWIMLPNPVYGGWQRVLPPAANALKIKQ